MMELYFLADAPRQNLLQLEKNRFWWSGCIQVYDMYIDLLVILSVVREYADDEGFILLHNS